MRGEMFYLAPSQPPPVAPGVPAARGGITLLPLSPPFPPRLLLLIFHPPEEMAPHQEKGKGEKTTATATLYSEETSWQKTSVIMLAITSVPPLLAHILLASHSLVSSSSPSRLAAASFLEVGGERKESRGRRGEGGTKFWQ